MPLLRVEQYRMVSLSLSSPHVEQTMGEENDDGDDE